MATQAFASVFAPNQTTAKPIKLGVVVFHVLVGLGIWLFGPSEVVPRPMEVFSAFPKLWHEGLGVELISSFLTNMKAIAISTFIALILSYLTVTEFFRPIATAVSKGRFLGMAGLTFLFTITIGGGHKLKIAMLVFGMTVFFVTSMAAVVANIPRDEYDHARTLRMGRWRVVWEVVILGKLDDAFEVLRQNAAIGWMMLTMVEGLVRSEGGLGAMLLAENKHFQLSAVFAIQLLILGIGLLQDFAIGFAKNLICPYARLTLERR